MIGEFWTRISIWLALTLYGGSVVCYLEKELWLARFFWTIGCLAYMVHVVCAFHFFHDWSHDLAAGFVGVRTEAVVGWRASIGIYVNYLFSAVWLFDTVFWLLVGNERYSRRNAKISWWLHGFFIFMILNGAVLFAQGNSRIAGAVLLTVILANFMIAGIKKKRNEKAAS